jgi:uncharacterized protein YndB with AHSA1/START domain
MADVMAPGYVLEMEHRYAAPRERVFQAWTHPNVLERWWAAVAHWPAAFAEIDLRPGGSYRLAMRDIDNDSIYVVGGEFREIVEPERLVYTWTWETAPEIPGSENSLVTVEFIEDGDGTLVRLTHSGFATEAVRDEHRQGWGGCLENLERRVFPVKQGGA